jgi:hypothetical protein
MSYYKMQNAKYETKSRWILESGFQNENGLNWLGFFCAHVQLRSNVVVCYVSTILYLTTL